jgi:hypothetical protein
VTRLNVSSKVRHNSRTAAGEEGVATYRQKEENRMKNSDNDMLGASGAGAAFIGYVDEVNGHGAEEVKEFVPTRHELLQLAQHWARTAIEIEYDWFLYQDCSSSEWRQTSFAWRRVNRIARVIGEEEVNKAIEQVKTEMGENAGPKTWHAFWEGTEEERAAVQDEIESEGWISLLNTRKAGESNERSCS